MKPKPQVLNVDEVQTSSRTSPAHRIIAELDGEFYTMRQTAEVCGVHIETLRRLCKTDKVKAPSKATRSGKLIIYLFTPDDVQEVMNYFNGRDEIQEQGFKVHGNQKTEFIR